MLFENAVEALHQAHARRLLLCLLLLISSESALSAERPSKRTPDEVLLVFNANSPISKAVADDYAQKRKVTHVLQIHCADSAMRTEDETISMEDYTKLIETPVHDYLATHEKIDFIVLTKGVPIRIDGAETGCRGDDSAPTTPLQACVDNHLAAMDYKNLPDAVKISITGSGATGYGWLNRYWNANESFSHATFGGYLVARLDGYTEADAKALVSRALAAEQGLSDGKVLLDVQPNFELGEKATQPAPIKEKKILRESDWSEFNADMRHAHDVLDARGISNELDLSPAFVGHRTGLLGYFSWGSNDAKFSNSAYQSLVFAPGSISDTAVSTSARTFLRTKGGQSLLIDLIAHGLTCGKGYTDEPLLQAIASPTIVMDRYTSGYTAAESLYAASHFNGWEDVYVGDPLCCPYWGKAK